MPRKACLSLLLFAAVALALTGCGGGGGGGTQYTLDAPTGISASDGAFDYIALTWNAVAEATGYDVYRATAQDGSYTKVNSVPVTETAMNDDDPALHFSNFYWYKIKALRGNDSSAFSVAERGYLAARVSTIAGTAGSTGKDDGTGMAARFNNPRAITTDGTYLYVADASNNAVRRIAIATGEVYTIAGTGTLYPCGITTDGTYLYVASTDQHTIRKISIATGEATTLAGFIGQSGSSDGIGTAARFNFPGGLTTDGTNLYVADKRNHTIRKVVIATGEVSTLAGLAGEEGGTDGTGSEARFSDPQGLTTDGANLYVCSGHAIRKIVIATGEVSTFAGVHNMVGSSDGIGSSALFYFPVGITTDGVNLYVTDALNHTIRKIVIATREVTTLAGLTGNSGSADGAGHAARFNWSWGIVSDGTNLYVADTNNHTIRKLE